MNTCLIEINSGSELPIFQHSMSIHTSWWKNEKQPPTIIFLQRLALNDIWFKPFFSKINSQKTEKWSI